MSDNVCSISEFINSMNIEMSCLIDLLEYEQLIRYKKINKIKLSDKENFFDLYMVKPSTMFRIINKRVDKK